MLVDRLNCHFSVWNRFVITHSDCSEVATSNHFLYSVLLLNVSLACSEMNWSDFDRLWPAYGFGFTAIWTAKTTTHLYSEIYYGVQEID